MAKVQKVQFFGASKEEHLMSDQEEESAPLSAVIEKPLIRATPLIVFLCVACAGLSNGLFGLELSVISSAKIDFAADYDIASTSFEYGFLASGTPIGATFGAIAAGFLQGSIGRRFTLILACLVYIGAVFFAYFANGFGMLAWARLQVGLAIGLFSSTAPMYIAELSPAHIRGKLVTVNQVCICTGILLGYVADKQLSPKWRLEFMSGLPLAALLLLAFVFITPFSPRWLMTRGREEEARSVLTLIRGGRDNPEVGVEIEAEMDAIRKSVDAAKSSNPWDVIKERWVMHAVFVGVMLAFIQQWSGANAVNAYATDILKSAGFNTSDAQTQSIYIGVVKLGFVVVALAMMDRLGRRTLLLAGTLGMSISLACIGASLSIASSPPLFSAIGLFSYMGFFEISLGPVMWLLLSELYPLSVRGPAMAIGSTSCWIFTVSVTLLYPSLSGALGTSGVFVVFAVVCALALVWIYFVVPETRGKSLEEIEIMLREGRTR